MINIWSERMSGRNMSNDVLGERKVLGDLTNVNGKRRLHLAPGKFVIGNGIGAVESHLENRILDSGTKKRVCRGPESLFNEAERIHNISSNNINEERKSWKTWMFSENKVGSKFPSPDSHLPCSSHFEHQQENSQENKRISLKLPRKVIARRGALNPGLHYIRGKASKHEAYADWQDGNDCFSAISAPVKCGRSQSAPVLKEGFKGNISVPCINQTEKTSCANCPIESSELEFMTSNKNLTQNSEILTADLLDNCCTQGSGNLQSTSVNQPFDSMHAANMSTPVTRCDDSTSRAAHGNKSCSCNFCLKAFYIWADLLSQDVRGRLAELGKSIRSAKTLAEKDYFRDFTRGCSEKSLKYGRMEIDLAQKWKSLFANTGNVLQYEGAQMQASLLKLKELTASCKRDLETTSAVPLTLPEESDRSD